jgi:hypothetical protein
MISLIPPKNIKDDPSETNLGHKPPHEHQSLALSPIEEGEYVIIKDSKESKTWYCAQVLEKLPDRIKVSYYTTITPSLTRYAKASYEEKLSRINEAIFLKTWSIPTGESTTVEPVSSKKKNVLLIRNVGLAALGSLTSPTAILAANLKIAHQVGA